MTSVPTAVVWQLDGRPHEGLDYGTRLRDLLQEAGLDVSVVALDRRAPSAQEISAPVHVLSGGTTLATSTEPWMTAARASLLGPLERARDGEALVLGICLGAQLIAEQLLGAGATGPSPAGLHMGLDAVHGHEPPWPSYAAVPDFHYYEVFPDAVRASRTARLVLRGEHSEVEGFTVGQHVLAVQFHPELTVDDLERMVHHNRSLLRDFGLVPAQLLQRMEERAGGWTSAAAQDLLVRPVLRFVADGSGISSSLAG